MAAAPTVTGPKKNFYRTSWFASLVLLVAAALAYSNSFRGPFVFDDELAILANPTIRSFGTAWSPPHEAAMGGLPISGRPIVNLSVAFNYALGGYSVAGYHLFNLLVHIAAGCFFFGIVWRTLLQPTLAPRFGTRAFELALVAAALWIVHPLQTESVTYISQRAEALLGLFYFATLWCFIRALEPNASRGWAAGAVLSCAVGMATKEVMVSAPLFAALYAWTLTAASWREVFQRHRRLLLGLASTWVVLAWFVIRAGGTRGVSAGFGLGVSPWTYLLTQCEAIVLYLKLSFWPHPLVLDYGTLLVRSAGDVWWQGVLLIALLVGTVVAVSRKSVLGCLGAWFFLILAPSSSVLPLVGQTIAEHRMYLPLAAVVVLTVTVTYYLWATNALWLLAGCTVALVAVTVARNQTYATAIGLYEDIVAKRPDNARAMALLADYYHRAGQLEPARRWLERSLEVQPRVVPVLNNLGNVWQELGNFPNAIVRLREALALRPGDVTTMNNLGNALILSGQTAAGLSQLDAAVKADPQHTGARGNFASALAQSGRFADAAAQFELLLHAEPNDAEAHASYSEVLTALGRRDDAIAQLEHAVKLRPNDGALRNRLGAALGRAGRLREAVEQFQAALHIDPKDESARQNLALAQRRLGGN